MDFLAEFEKTLAKKCAQNEPAFCTAKCPFALDVKGLIGMWKKGRFNAAFRTYQNSVGFPKIVASLCPHPCEGACVRAKKDGAVALNALERATVALATRKKPNEYNMPMKDKRVAIVGAGMSGLACALPLCNRKYQVTIFERSEELGGSLRKETAWEEYSKDIEAQFEFESMELLTEHEVTSLDELSDYDAVYIATGHGGSDFGLSLTGTGAFATERAGVFMGGGVTGRNTVEAIADGLNAARAIERYIKTGFMNEPVTERCTKLDPKAIAFEESPRVAPETGVYTADEAAREASRCAMCSCDACMKECALMRIYEKTPRRIYEEAYVSINPVTLTGEGAWATRLIATCDKCGLCREACPEHIDIGAFLSESHRAMREKNKMPWAYHDHYLRELAFSNGEAAFTARGRASSKKPKYAFFPGCQLGASDPEYVKRSFSWILSREPDSVLIERCCGVPALWAAEDERFAACLDEIREEWEKLDKPELILACPSCKRLFDEHLSDIPTSFLYDKLLEWGASEVNARIEEPCAVFDPCASREYASVQSSVRKLAEDAGVKLREIAHAGRMAECCGYGGQTAVAAPDFVRRVARERAGEADEAYIAYCTNCRDVFSSTGKRAYHILDIIFGINGGDRKPPTVTERWENRRKLKRDMAKEYILENGAELADEKKGESMELYIDDALRARLSSEMILEEDIEAVVAYAEAENAKIYNPTTGRYTAHRKLQNMTYWAEYAKEGAGFRLYSAYQHRMCIESENAANKEGK